jgi:hypothetical protein
MSHLQIYQTIANVVGCGKKLKVMPRWQVSIVAGLTDMVQPPTSGPVPLTGTRLRLESQFFYYETTKARSTFNMPQTPLRITIGRTYEWYESMGEFEGVYEKLEKEDGICKHCKRTRYCKWPPPSIQQTQGQRQGQNESL